VSAAGDTLLLGTLSLDRHLATGEDLPGGGILNMAWHWRRLGRPFSVISRIGDADGAPILRFLDRNGIDADRAALVAAGRSSMIDIEIRADRQPWMDRFVPGVWDRVDPTPAERRAIRGARRVHTVLIEGAIDLLERLAAAGDLDAPSVSADFLGFRHYTVERLARTMAHVDLGFIGWPGEEGDPTVSGMRAVAFDLGRLLVVTMGSSAVRVFDGRALDGRPRRQDRRFPVHAVPVTGTTLGCGDAFIAWFLDAWYRTGDLDAAMDRGMIGGALATTWDLPLPDAAYRDQPTPREA
jgi:sugar/nucleoside kinase (ribokinase family)